MTKMGVEGKYLESQQQTDYEKNINAFIEEKCDLIVTVGFLLGDATKAAAEANPDVKFAIVDYAYDPVIPNVLGLIFATDQAAFLAGYVAAGITKTGKVGTFGGIQIPTVTIFMDGFYCGVQYYNEKNGTNVEVLGWDPATQKGLFTGNFESTDDGRAMGETLMDEGADIIMPVAGPVGLGTAAAVKNAAMPRSLASTPTGLSSVRRLQRHHPDLRSEEHGCHRHTMPSRPLLMAPSRVASLPARWRMAALASPRLPLLHPKAAAELQGRRQIIKADLIAGTSQDRQVILS